MVWRYARELGLAGEVTIQMVSSPALAEGKRRLLPRSAGWSATRRRMDRDDRRFRQ